MTVATVSIRPLAVPSEHGGWGLLLEPIALGLLVAPSAGGALIGMGAAAVFLMRHPLKLAIHDLLQRKRYPRSGLCELLAAGYGAAAVLAFLGAWTLAGSRPLLALAAALPFGAIQFSYDVRNRSRRAIPEVAGAMVPASLAAAIAIAGGSAAAAVLSVLILCRSIPSVLYVRSTLRGGSRVPMLAAHIAAVLVAAWIAPPLACAATLLLLVRAAVPVQAPARIIGLREVAFGAITVGLIALAF
ncbi:MAG: YwiC-like family protein [Thermoanaerobaculia bacterium]